MPGAAGDAAGQPTTMDSHSSAACRPVMIQPLLETPTHDWTCVAHLPPVPWFLARHYNEPCGLHYWLSMEHSQTALSMTMLHRPGADRLVCILAGAGDTSDLPSFVALSLDSVPKAAGRGVPETAAQPATDGAAGPAVAESTAAAADLAAALAWRYALCAGRPTFPCVTMLLAQGSSTLRSQATP
jgi:hypothetical protein